MGVGAAALAYATVRMLQGAEPFATAFYIFAWYSTLLALYGALSLVAGRSPSLRHPASLLTMLGWSSVVWLFFELLNFRVRNWYYVFVPADLGWRWATTVVSFATVLPAVFGAEALLDALGSFERVRWPRLRVTPRLLRGVQIAGAGMLVLPLLWPRWFFPLVWGTTTFLLEPMVYRRDPERSLLRDLELGRPGRLLRILIGGAAIGFVWEMYNIEARAKWIYTVPGLEELKLFEMPVLGFLGFPPFAVDCYVIWQLLVLGGVAVPLAGRARPAPTARRVGTALAAAVFVVCILAGMERFTFSSVTPRLDGLPAVPAALLRDGGYDVFALAAATPEDVERRTGASAAQALGWIETAKLARLRGIGDANARLLREVGIVSVSDLAGADAADLAARLQARTATEVVDARIRVWVRAARAALREERYPSTTMSPAGPGVSSPTSAAGTPAATSSAAS
ncbi:MAG TPA: DUF4332 domain-containing protein [Longimicrobiales bacterium]|nr:DUF4332 domain-containing protein [Longimicrobiales bacterium]